MPIANQTRKRKLGTLVKTDFFRVVGNVTCSPAHVKFVACFDYDFLFCFASVFNGCFDLKGKRHSRVLSLALFLSCSALYLGRFGREMTHKENVQIGRNRDVSVELMSTRDHSRKEKLIFFTRNGVVWVRFSTSYLGLTIFVSVFVCNVFILVCCLLITKRFFNRKFILYRFVFLLVGFCFFVFL